MSHHVLVGLAPSEVTDRRRLAALTHDLGASLAFLQVGQPTLTGELDRLTDLGATRIVLVGYTTSRLAPGLSWLRRIADHWWREAHHRNQHETDRAPVPEVATALQIVRSPAETEARWAALSSAARGVRGTSAPLSSAAWEDVPGHRRQVLVCRGPRCATAGSNATHEALVLAMMEAGLSDDDALLTVTGCQFPCNQAPLVSVQPDDVWYGSVTPEVAGEIVREHLAEGRVVPAARLARRVCSPEA